MFTRAGISVQVTRDVKKRECGLLYNRHIRENIKLLRNADPGRLEAFAERLKNKRLKWFKAQQFQDKDDGDPLMSAYRLFLTKLGITPEEAPIVDRQKNKLIIHSKNFCPTLEACKILGLDTREVCKKLSEEPTQALLRQLHPGLVFKRNYGSLRPYTPYCEEMIIMEDEQ